MATASVKFVVAAAVREALSDIPANAGKVGITRRQRQIMAHGFPYIKVAEISEEDLLDQLWDDTKATIERLSGAEPEEAEPEPPGAVPSP